MENEISNGRAMRILSGVFAVALVVAVGWTFFLTRSCSRNAAAIARETEIIRTIDRTNVVIQERIRWIERTNVVILRSNAILEKIISNADPISGARSLDDAVRIFRSL